jgi:PIN domain nuclease of toxin-antitoxin system
VNHIVSAANLPQIHHDPGDRILVAQALAEGVPLVTIDSEIHGYDVPYIWE